MRPRTVAPCEGAASSLHSWRRGMLCLSSRVLGSPPSVLRSIWRPQMRLHKAEGSRAAGRDGPACEQVLRGGGHQTEPPRPLQSRGLLPAAATVWGSRGWGSRGGLFPHPGQRTWLRGKRTPLPRPGISEVMCAWERPQPAPGCRMLMTCDSGGHPARSHCPEALLLGPLLAACLLPLLALAACAVVIGSGQFAAAS